MYTKMDEDINYRKYRKYRKKLGYLTNSISIYTEKNPNVLTMRGGNNILLNKLSGANTLYYYNVLNSEDNTIIDKKILLLGEIHTQGSCYPCDSSKGCSTIDAYITNLIKEQDITCIDYYKEGYYIYHTKSLVGGNLQDSSHFWNRVDSYDNIRIHNWDLRQININNERDSNGDIILYHNIFANWIQKVYDYKKSYVRDRPITEYIYLIDGFNKSFNPMNGNKITIDVNVGKTIDDWFNYNLRNLSTYLKNFPDYMWGDDSETSIEVVQNIYNGLLDTLTIPISQDEKIKVFAILEISIAKTKKSISKMSKLYNIKLVKLSYIYYWSNLIIKEFKELIHEHVAKLPIGALYEIKLPLTLSIVELLTLPITDLYLLARMFTNFDMNKMIRSPKGCETTNIPKNIILYAGSSHTSLINLMLQKFILKIKPIFSIENNLVASGKCIDFKEQVVLL